MVEENQENGQRTLFNKASGWTVPIESAVKSFNNLALGVRLCRQRGDDSVSAYDIGSNGAPTPIQGSPFATGNSPTKMAVDQMARFAYVANWGDDSLSAYSIALR